MDALRSSCATALSRPRVVYVMGAGRSGSTVLDMFLGQHPQVQSAGELCNTISLGYLAQELCSCKQSVPECPFWSEVLKIWQKQCAINFEDYETLRRRVEDDLSVLWQMLWKPSPERINLGPQIRGNFLTYAQWTAGLYRAMSEVSGRPLVVDSSKSPIRGLALVLLAQRLDLIDLHLIHLVRDVRGFAWSNRKRFQRNQEPGVTRDLPGRTITKSALIWVYVNTLSDWVRQRHGLQQTTLLRYEDFAARTPGTILELAGFLGVSPQPWIDLLSLEKDMTPGHVVAGNRLRMRNQIKLRPDLEWQSGLSGLQKLWLWGLAGWKAHSYGYRYHVSQPTSDSPHAGDTPPADHGHPLAGPHFLHDRHPTSSCETQLVTHPARLESRSDNG